MFLDFLDHFKLISNIKKYNYRFHGDSWGSVSEKAKDLIKNMLTQKDKRISSKEILNHPWLKLDDQPQKALNIDFKSFQKFRSLKKL